MFGNGKTTGVRTSRSNDSDCTNTGCTVINEGTVVTGSIESNGDIRIDGTLVGDLNCGAKVIVGATGTLNGNVRARCAVIEGQVTGDLCLSDLLVLQDSANIVGDIRTGRLSVGAGCSLVGQCEVNASAAAHSEVSDNVALAAA